VNPDLTTAGDAALRRCVACSASEFARRNWGHTPRLSRAADLGGSGFTDLLDPAAIDELVSRRGLRTPFLRMAKDGAVLDRSRFTRGGGAGASIDDQVADDQVLRQLDDGATLVLQALHRTWPPLVDFGATLAAELGHPVQINAYITPPQNQGFAPHYDVHDVFVLQVVGRKHWTVHAPVVTDPLVGQNWEKYRDAVAARANEDALFDVVLEPGDTLYLPRGTIHSASALGSTTVHLTVGVHPVTRHHLLTHLLELVADDPALRTSLPAGVDLADPAVLAPHLAATVDALIARVRSATASAAADDVARLLQRQTRPAPIGPLAQLAAADNVHAKTPLRLRSALRIQVRRADDGVTLSLLDRTVTLPGVVEAAVKTVLSGATFAPFELAGLDDEEQLVIARRLLREGIVVPA
jgi:hypothetical protein